MGAGVYPTESVDVLVFELKVLFVMQFSSFETPGG